MAVCKLLLVAMATTGFVVLATAGVVTPEQLGGDDKVDFETLSEVETPDGGLSMKEEDSCGAIHFHLSSCSFCDTSLTFERYLIDHKYTKRMNRARRKRAEIKTGCGCDANICDCSSSKLVQIPPLKNKDTIVGLDLTNNRLDSRVDFSGFKSLKFVRLCCNNITKISRNFIQTVPKLQYLNLVENNLEMPLEDGLFSPLKELYHLELQGNVEMGGPNSSFGYPGNALVGLTKLKTLQLDGFLNQSLGPEFKTLTSLKYFQLAGFSSGYCNLCAINDSTFSNLPSSVISLNISSCNIKTWQMGNTSAKVFGRLKTLDISENQMGLGQFVDNMCKIRNFSIEHLHMSSIVPRYSRCIEVDSGTANCLPRRLTHLKAAGNSFDSFQEGFFDALPENLTFVDVSDNKIQFGSYLKHIWKMKNLDTLIVEGSSYSYRIPGYYPENFHDLKPGQSSQDNSFYENSNGQRAHWSRQVSELLQKRMDQRLPRSDQLFKKDRFLLHLPPKLKHVSFNKYNLRYIISSIDVNDTNVLETMDLSNNYFPQIWGYLNGLNSLRWLHIKRCGTHFMSGTLFKSLPALEAINLQDNSLGNRFFSKRMFKYASKLKYLTLDSNLLSVLHNDTFEGLNGLEELYLTHNPFSQFSVNLSHNPKLRHLDLSYTGVTHLNKKTQERIDQSGIRLLMKGTPIFCTCENLQFLTWISKSTSINLSEGYKCAFQMKKDTPISDEYRHAISVLEGECPEHTSIFYAVLASCSLMLCFVIGAVIYRFRWKLRYMYYAAYLKLKDTDQEIDEDNFKHDVFLSYAFQDHGFVMETLNPALTSRGLKVLIHSRDFVAGQYIASNIVSAVKKSRKTLVLLTQNLLDSNWCNYELQMANLEAVNTGRPVLLFLLKEELPKNRLGTELLYHINNNTYKEYPPEDLQPTEEDMETFWNSLVRDIKK